ncbi:hypothetical protein CKO40_00850 [Halochromatium glycolicum]|uniref:Uncharacterized protein n=1 Tax=Halochromatium glycolicum TaxID=85075 RepID=A0AAJ0U0K5_9GAMM|nr:hypothetical protein [Halochromatium glycolicum]
MRTTQQLSSTLLHDVAETMKAEREANIDTATAQTLRLFAERITANDDVLDLILFRGSARRWCAQRPVRRTSITSVSWRSLPQTRSS